MKNATGVNTRSQLKLSDVCEFIADCPHSTAPDEGDGYPLIRTPNIGKGRLLLDGVHRVSKETYDIRNKRAVPQPDDIIFAREAPAGNAALIRPGQEVCLGQRTVLIRPNPDKVSPQYLVYYILAPQQQYKLLGTANGATVAHVNIPAIKEMPVELPPLETQIKIGEILSAYDDLIENNQKQIKLLEEAAQRLYKEWFVDLHFPGYEKTPVADGIPEGWEYRTLSSFGNIITGKTPATSKTDNYGDSVPFVKIPDMHGNIYPLRTELMLSDTGAESQRGKFIPPRSLLVSCIATVGLVNITIERCQTNQQINALIPNNCCDLYYLYFAIRDKKETLIAIGSNGATMTNVNKEKFGKVKVLYPSEELVKEYNAFATDIFEKVLRLSKSIIHLQTVRDFLLTKLMNGELEV